MNIKGGKGRWVIRCFTCDVEFSPWCVCVCARVSVRAQVVYDIIGLIFVLEIKDSAA